VTQTPKLAKQCRYWSSQKHAKYTCS